MKGKQVSLKVYDIFKCIGGSCPTNCCMGWSSILWKRQEIDKILQSNCSEQLLELANKSFVEDDGKFHIDEINGMCPFLNSNKMCSIQLELGHDFLSCTCQRYPRKTLLNQDRLFCAMGGSCYEVLTLLCNNADSAQLVYKPTSITKNIVANDAEDVRTFFSHPEMKYRSKMFELLYGVISDKSYSVETGIILGALAMQKISQYVENGEVDRIPEVIEAIRPQLKNKAQIDKLEAIQANYSLKYSLLDKILESYIHKQLPRKADGSPEVEFYQNGYAKFLEVFSDRPFALKNVIINSLFDIKLPCYSSKLSLYDNYCYFVYYVAAIKFIAAFSGYADDCEHYFKTSVAKLSRTYCHTNDYIQIVINEMKKYNCTSPAYLASLIK